MSRGRIDLSSPKGGPGRAVANDAPVGKAKGAASKSDRVKLIVALSVLALAGALIAYNFLPSGGGGSAATPGDPSVSAPAPEVLAPGATEVPAPERPRGSGKKPGG